MSGKQVLAMRDQACAKALATMIAIVGAGLGWWILAGRLRGAAVSLELPLMWLDKRETEPRPLSTWRALFRLGRIAGKLR